MDLYDQAVSLWRSFSIASEKQLDQHLDNFRVLFAYNSGKIENTEIDLYDTRDIFEGKRIVINFSGRPRALLEQQNQKLCYEFLKSKIIKREPLSMDLVLDIHQAITGGTYDEHLYVENGERPGSFKKHDYITGIHEVGSAPENVENNMKDLLDEVNAYDGKQILNTAAYFHAKFEFIHPFADGNGRVGRTLLNYYLMTRNHPPLIIDYKDKRLYFEGLRRYDEAEDLDLLSEFLEDETGKTWGKAVQRSEGIKEKRKTLSDFMEEA